MSSKFLIVGSLIVLGFGPQTWASHSYPSPLTSTGQITYVDATHSHPSGSPMGNTSLASGGPFDSNSALTTTLAVDNKWRFSPQGNNGVNFSGSTLGSSAYDSNDTIATNPSDPGEDSPRLVTQVPTILTPGTPVHLYVYFWTDNTDWRIRAGLNNVSPLTLYAASNYQAATPQTANLGSNGDNVPPFYFANMPPGSIVRTLPATPTLNLMEGYLGIGTVDVGGNVVVFVDDDDITTAPAHGNVPTRNLRTRYDGIGIVEASPGSSQETPILPGPSGPNGWTFNGVPSRRWYDPPLVDRYDFDIESGSLFTLAGMPVGFDGSFEVYVGNSSLGSFDGGDEVDFVTLTGGGVSGFSVRGIDPLVDADDPEGFPIFLEFDTETATFTMTPVVPEPATIALLVLGICGVMAIRRKMPYDPR